jgi:hypothetical protein
MTPIGRRSAGQAQIELVAAIPIVVCVGAVILQLMAVGYVQSLADGSAEAGAYAIAAGRAPAPAARAALPGWAAKRARVEADSGRVSVSLRAPSLIGALGRRLAVSSSAWARGESGAGG